MKDRQIIMLMYEFIVDNHWDIQEKIKLWMLTVYFFTGDLRLHIQEIFVPDS